MVYLYAYIYLYVAEVLHISSFMIRDTYSSARSLRFNSLFIDALKTISSCIFSLVIQTSTLVSTLN